MTGLEHARGTHVLIFDADLEYSPDDVAAMIEPVLADQADIVFGRRPLKATGGHRGFRFLFGNLVTTALARVLYRSSLSDIHTCFKLVPRDLLLRMPLREERFGLDTQITVGSLSSGERLREVPISYRPRTRSQGKKIGWKDGVRCIFLLLKYRVVPALGAPHAAHAVDSVPAQLDLGGAAVA
jgi:glycosyltransferase involved in cell wall biosynthesis